MAETTNIEWCDATFNPWIGCTKVSLACDDCYAARSTPARTLGVAWGPHERRRRTSEGNWAMPVRWNAQHEAFYAQHGRRRRVFCASLADVFDNAVPDTWRADLFELIRATPNLDWLLLTKRIGNVGNMLPVPFDFERIYPNVWLGATICNQAEADRDIPKLLALDATVRFLSIEPMLGPIELHRWLAIHKHWKTADDIGHAPWCPPYPKHWWEHQRLVGAGYKPPLQWVICGGESGLQARPMRSVWAQNLRDQCAAARVPFLFKQWGEYLGEKQDGNLDHNPVELNATADPVRVGKKAAGRTLDGVEHNGFPELT